jgi:hypothetical protein
MRPARPLS